MTSKPLGILAADPFGPSMAGPARRSLALARELASPGWHYTDPPEVDVIPTELWFEGDEPDPLPHVTFRRYDLAAWLRASEDYQAVVIPSQFALKEHRVFDAPCIRIVDCTVPFPVETASLLIGAPPEEQKQITRLQSWAINRAVSAADYWLISNREQEAWLLGILASLGRLSPALAQSYSGGPLVRRIIYAAYGFDFRGELDPAPRVALLAKLELPPETPYLLWTGGLWPWMAPEVAVQAMGYLRDGKGGDLHLLMPGASAAPGNIPASPGQRAIQEALQDPEIRRRVHLLDWIPAADWPAIADGALLHVSAHHYTPEVVTSYRTRYLEAVKYRKFLVASFDPLSEELSRYGSVRIQLWEVHPQFLASAIEDSLSKIRNQQENDVDYARENGWSSDWEDFYTWSAHLHTLAWALRDGLTPHPDGPWTPDMAGNPAAAPPTPTLLDRAMNKLRRITR